MSTTAVSPEVPAIPAFLTKLRLLVDDEETNDLIYWDPTGSSFHIADGNRLAKEILPLFFKHNNLSSFVRQLNMYGFRKVNRIEAVPAGFKSDTEDMEFRHPFFIRQRPHLLSKIHRKPPNGAYGGVVGGGRLFSNVGSSVFPQSSPVRESPNLNHRFSNASDMIRLSTLIRNMRMTQENMAQQMNLLQTENELLFRELHDLRERHERQAQLIQTLFSFLSAFAKDTRTQGFHFGRKRKALPLAISDGQQSHSGLRLNLPQGYRLDDNSLVDVPYTLVKRDPDATAAPNNQLVALTNSDSFRAETSSADYNWDTPSGINTTAAFTESTNSSQLPVIPFKQKRLAKRGSLGSFLHPTGNISADAPVQLLAAGAPVAFTNEENCYPSIDVASEVDVKPTLNQSDQTLALLTTMEQPTSKPVIGLPPSPASTGLGDLGILASGDHVLQPQQQQQQLIDLNLSRCTTPASLIQPDSVDICELLGANRNDVESEISIDDLFLASGALDEITNSSNNNNNVQERLDRFARSSALSASRVGRDPVDNALLNSFGNTGRSRSFVLSPGPENLSPAPTTTASTTNADTTTPCLTSTGRPRQSATMVPCSGSQPVRNSDENLFGLTWDEETDNGVVVDEESAAAAETGGGGGGVFHSDPDLVEGDVTIVDDDSMDQLNAGLLPQVGPDATTRTNNLVTIMPHSEVIPTNQSRVGFPNQAFIVEPTNLVRVLQPTVSLGLPAIARTIQPANPLPPTSQPTNQPLLLPRTQPKRVLMPSSSTPAALRAVSLSPTTTCLVQAASPVNTLRMASNPVHVGAPFFRVQPGHVMRPASTVGPSSSHTARNLPIRRKERPVYRPIAPAPSPRQASANLPRQQNP